MHAQRFYYRFWLTATITATVVSNFRKSHPSYGVDNTNERARVNPLFFIYELFGKDVGAHNASDAITEVTVLLDSIEDPLKWHSVRSREMPHSWCLSGLQHSYGCLVVLKHIQTNTFPEHYFPEVQGRVTQQLGAMHSRQGFRFSGRQALASLLFGDGS